MKREVVTRSILLLLVSVLITSLPFNSNAQNDTTAISDTANLLLLVPELTAEQNLKAKKFRENYLKEERQLKKELAEKQAYLVSVLSADTIDRVAMNRAIDELSVIKGRQMKNNANYTINVMQLKHEPEKVFLVVLIRTVLEGLINH